MSTTKTTQYRSLCVNVEDLSADSVYSIAGPDVQRLRNLYFSDDHKIPLNDLDFGFQLIRTTIHPSSMFEKEGVLPSVKEAVAFFTASITMKSSVSSFVPSNDLIRASRFDPYKPVAWIREFAHDPWENPLLLADWVVHKVRSYAASIPTKDVAHSCPREIVWKIPETYLELQKSLLAKGFIVERFHREYLTFSLILA